MSFRVLALTVPAAMIAACTTTMATTPAAGQVMFATARPTPATTPTEGTFLPYRPGATAITYHPEVVPPGASARLTITNLPYGTDIRLTASNLLPDRPYGAHLHTAPCTADPAAAGPHYQHHHDPAAASSAPSTNPHYANPRNEVWLDFTTDATGMGSAVSTHGWDFDPAAPPRSLVIHAGRTQTAPGTAGTAGPRAACLTLPAT
jgi:Cu-Zn family superoxide dismutase